MYKILVLALTLCLASGFRISRGSKYESCMRGDEIPGVCVLSSNCSTFMGVSQRIQNAEKPLDADLNYVMNSECPVYRKNFVCCEKEEISAGMRKLMQQDCGYFDGVLTTYKELKVELMSRPWMALLAVQLNSTYQRFFCGGTLITERFVLTAAHCVYNKPTRRISVRLGEHTISEEIDCQDDKCAPKFEEIAIERYVIHEDFEMLFAYNDIALVKLSRDVQMQESIKTICLPLNGELQEATESMPKFHVTAWGQTKNLREVIVTPKPREICERIQQKPSEASQICAGEAGISFYKGDSGSPLMYVSLYNGSQRYVQFGLLSVGKLNRSAVFTNVASHISWIAEKIRTT